MKRVQCLCVKVIDILPTFLLIPSSYSSFHSSQFLTLFSSPLSLSLNFHHVFSQLYRRCLFPYMSSSPVSFKPLTCSLTVFLCLLSLLLILFFPSLFQLVSSDTPTAEPPVAVVPPVETPTQPSPPPPPLPPPPAERTGGIGDSRPPSFQ